MIAGIPSLPIDSLTSLLTAIPIIIILLLTAYYTYKELKGVLRTGRLFIRVVGHNRKEEILEDIQYLLNMPDEMVKRLSERHEMIRSVYSASLDQIIKKHTKELDEPTTVAIYDENYEARFYTDFVEASIESNDDLRELSEMLSFYILNNCAEYTNGEIDRVVAMGNGNVILANEVAKQLELPLIMAGNVRGEEETIIGNYDSGDNVLIIDDIAFTGTMMTKVLEILSQNDLICVDIYVVLKRSSACDVSISRYNTENSTGINIESIRRLDDEDIAEIMR